MKVPAGNWEEIRRGKVTDADGKLWQIVGAHGDHSLILDPVIEANSGGGSLDERQRTIVVVGTDFADGFVWQRQADQEVAL